jgi:ABC-2 type transport system permease protein
MRASFQEDAAYRTNFFISLFTSLLNLLTGVLGILVLFGQIDSVHGWTLASTLAVLGVYLVVSAVRGLFISPSFDSLSGMDGEIWSGAFDFTILRPVNTQFFASFRKWRLFALLDLVLGVGVLVAAVIQLGVVLSVWQVLFFLFMLVVGMSILYAILLIFAALIFWSPGVLFTWVFDGLFQMARYPTNIYPGWLRMVLTWIVPVGVITTFPARALTDSITPLELLFSLLLAVVLLAAASILFRVGLRKYASASS